jgi:hypothetical protein
VQSSRHMKVVENFLLASGFSFGLDFSVIVRNAPGQTELEEKNNDLDSTFELLIYLDGEMVYKKENYAEIPFNGFYELKSSDIDFQFDRSKEYLIMVRGIKERDNDKTISREYVINYHNTNFPRRKSMLIFDAFPHVENKKSYAPITLLAHKCWLSSEVDCAIYFCNMNSGVTEKTLSSQPLSISIVSESGEIIAKHDAPIYLNSAYKFDVRDHLPQSIILDQKLKFFNVIAAGHDAQFSIFTVMKNKVSGALAMEHSLPPYYYVNPQNMADVRGKFLKNFAA